MLEGALAVANQEVLTDVQARLERLWLGLRTSEGIGLAELTREQLATAQAWVAQGWAVMTPERLRLTRSGWLRLDRLTVDLDSAETPPPSEPPPDGASL